MHLEELDEVERRVLVSVDDDNEREPILVEVMRPHIEVEGDELDVVVICEVGDASEYL